MQIIDRIQNILMHPREEWYVIEAEPTGAGDLYRGYIAPLAVLGPISALIGLSVIGISLPSVGTYRVPLNASLLSSLTSYALALVGVFLLAVVTNALAPYFSSQASPAQALKLVAYSSTPAWLAGIFTLVPGFGLLGLLLSLYSLYLLYLGVPALMKAPKDEVLGYTAVIAVSAFILSLLVGMASHGFIKLPEPVIPPAMEVPQPPAD